MESHPTESENDIQSVAQYQALMQVLRAHIKKLEQSSMQEMEERAKLVAENRRLQREVERLRGIATTPRAQQEQQHQQQQQQHLSRRTVTPKSRCSDHQVLVGAGSTGTSRSKGRKHSRDEDHEEQEEEEEEEDSDDLDEMSVSSDDGVVHKRQGRKAHVAKKKLYAKKFKKVNHGRPDSSTHYFYHCCVKGCNEWWAFGKHLSPPLTADDLVSDHIIWPSPAFSTHKKQVRAHMAAEHNDIPEESWPKGFAMPKNHKVGVANDKSTPTPQPRGRDVGQDVNGYYMYECPVDGCSETWRFPKAHKPPLNDAKLVCDQSFWSYKYFRGQTYSVRNHMKVRHPDVHPKKWPPGFGLVGRPSGGGDKNKIAASSTWIPWEDRTFDQTKYHTYHCPVRGCRKIFSLKRTLKPPLNKDGTVSDHRWWPSKCLQSHQKIIRTHMEEDHSDMPPEEWPPGFAWVGRGKKKAPPFASLEPATVTILAKSPVKNKPPSETRATERVLASEESSVPTEAHAIQDDAFVETGGYRGCR